MKLTIKNLRSIIKEELLRISEAYVGEISPIHSAIRDVYNSLPEKGHTLIANVFANLIDTGKIPVRTKKEAKDLKSWFNRTYGSEDLMPSVGENTANKVKIYLKAFRSPTSLYKYDGFYGTLERTEADTKKLEKFRSDTEGLYDLSTTTTQYRVMPRLYAKQGGELAEQIITYLSELVSKENPNKVFTVNDIIRIVNSNLETSNSIETSSDADMMTLHNAISFIANPQKAPSYVRSALATASEGVNIKVEPIKSSGGSELSVLANKLVVTWTGEKKSRELPKVPELPISKQKESQPSAFSGRFSMKQYDPGPAPKGITARPRGRKPAKFSR